MMSEPQPTDAIWEVPLESADPGRLNAYSYQLDEGRVAAEPSARRDDSRLLVYRGDADAIEHRRFDELAEFLEESDLLVFNKTRVVPARLEVFKETGGRVELFVVSPVEGRRSDDWRCSGGDAIRLECMSRSSRPIRVGMTLRNPDQPRLPSIEVVDVGEGRCVVEVPWEGSAVEFVDAFGTVPLPPYILRRRRKQQRPEVEPEDFERYQTVYADKPGAVAAPTAGLHFTEQLLERLDDRGIRCAELTLLVGPGTFEPVRQQMLSDHEMHAETYHIPPELAEKVEECRQRGGRVIAVGTTTTRALEAEARRTTPFRAGWRSTDLFLRPGVDFQVCDGLVTNFHLPESTLLALVAGFIGFESMRRVYSCAVDGPYRFYSYGDANLLLKRRDSDE